VVDQFEIEDRVAHHVLLKELKSTFKHELRCAALYHSYSARFIYVRSIPLLMTWMWFTHVIKMILLFFAKHDPNLIAADEN
jgi:hypothetical protein